MDLNPVFQRYASRWNLTGKIHRWKAENLWFFYHVSSFILENSWNHDYNFTFFLSNFSVTRHAETLGLSISTSASHSVHYSNKTCCCGHIYLYFRVLIISYFLYTFVIYSSKVPWRYILTQEYTFGRVQSVIPFYVRFMVPRSLRTPWRGVVCADTVC